MPRRSATPTMREIAQRANVSIGTVSRVLNRHSDVDAELRDRVESIARKVGYEFSARTRNAVQTKSRIVGLILLNNPGLSSSQSLMLLGVEEYCSAAGYCLLFARHQHAPHAAAGHLDAPGIVQTPGLADCLIIAGTIHSNMLQALENYGLRYVLLRNHLMETPEAKVHGALVGYDDGGGCLHATRYLAQLGHRHIWYIGDASRPWHRNRLQGYTKAIEELQLEPHVHAIALSDDEFENGQAAVSYILDQGWPMTAILAESDQLAFGSREGLRQHRRDVPKDVSMIAFEYEAGRGHASNLTSVSVDMVEVGRQLARAAIAQIENRPKDASNIMVPATLVKRSTCRPMRKDEHMML
jgi:DNA-binding LacI/PurR family transcriptional regulator